VLEGFLYRGQLQPAAWLDGAGGVKATFVYGTRVNVPEYMVVPAGTAAGTYRIVTDQVGSVRLVVNVNTGAVAEEIEYDEFGNVLADSNPGMQPFGFAGGLRDRDTGLTRFGARDYDSVVGRWAAKDPIGFRGGLSCLYGYVGSDPINCFDPTGRIIFNLGTALLGALVGGIINGATAWGNGQSFWLGFGVGAISGAIGGFTLNPFLVGAVAGGLQTFLNRLIKCPTDSDPLIDYAIGIGGGAITGGVAGNLVEGGPATQNLVGAVGGLLFNNVWALRNFFKEVSQ
jgi:RHS repeat-associated protein